MMKYVSKVTEMVSNFNPPKKVNMILPTLIFNLKTWLFLMYTKFKFLLLYFRLNASNLKLPWDMDIKWCIIWPDHKIEVRLKGTDIW